jgi:hypothetical protein
MERGLLSSDRFIVIPVTNRRLAREKRESGASHALTGVRALGPRFRDAFAGTAGL